MSSISSVLVVNYLGEGHVNPSIGLINELTRLGEKVTYYTSDQYQHKLNNTKVEVRSISMRAQVLMNEIFFDFFKSNNTNSSPMISNMDKMIQSMEWIADEILHDIQNESYDYMLFDAQSFPGKWVADVKKLPSFAMWSTFATNPKSPIFKNITEKWKPEIAEEFYKKREAMKPTIERLEKKYGVPIPSFLNGMEFDAEQHIVFTSRYFQPDSELYDDHFLFVGPSIMDRQEQTDFPVDELKEGQIVYMALGTIVNNRTDLYRICMDACKDLDVKVVLSIGNQLSLSDIEPIPNNFIVRNYVPQLEVLQHSDVFITHCGMNSTNEGLYFGNPLVMLPLVNDQPMVAQQVKNLGAGLILDQHTIDAATLRSAIIEALENPVYKENSLKISRSFHEAGGYVIAAKELVTKMQTMTQQSIPMY